MLLIKYRSVPWGLIIEGGRSQGARSEEQEKIKNRLCEYAGGGHIVKRLMYVLPLSAIAVLVFAAIAAAQDVPKGQEEGQEPSPTVTDANTTDVRNSTTVPAKKKANETITPAESTAPAPSSPTTVDINDDAFDPSRLNIAPGTTVRFANTGTGPHTATADNKLFDTKELEPGEFFEVYFGGSGSVTYHDELNPEMQGSIVVGGGAEAEDATSQKGTAAEEPESEPSSEADKQATESAKQTKD